MSEDESPSEMYQLQSAAILSKQVGSGSGLMGSHHDLLSGTHCGSVAMQMAKASIFSEIMRKKCH